MKVMDLSLEPAGASLLRIAQVPPGTSVEIRGRRSISRIR
jgi:hypothetical protein